MQALVITLGNYKRERQALEKWLGKQCDLRDLDLWKQRGFYTHQGTGGKFVVPSEVIDRAFSEAVIVVARRFVTTVDFLPKENLQRYREFASAIRSRWHEGDHDAFTAHVSDVIDELFGVVADRIDVGGEGGGVTPH